MQVRLAFATAIQTDPEILLMDEVLAVGDMEFQQKCLDVFQRYIMERKTIVFVSHDMNSVRRFFKKAVFIDKCGKENTTFYSGYPIISANLAEYTRDESSIKVSISSKNQPCRNPYHWKQYALFRKHRMIPHELHQKIRDYAPLTRFLHAAELPE